MLPCETFTVLAGAHSAAVDVGNTTKKPIMTPLSAELFARLLYEGESDALDFKAEQYEFVDGSVESKSELLKDILAFANSWRRVEAYIVLGAREVKGGRAIVTGVSSHIDDAALQQFVNTKLQRPIRFSYVPLRVEDKDVALIHVPLQDRPFYLTDRFGKLAPNTVYIRRGSSTDVALPDEIARMGKSEASLGEIALDVFFVDPTTRTRIEPAVKSRVLVGPRRSDIPEYRSERSNYAYLASMIHDNRDYYRDLVDFTVANQLLSPLYLAIQNSGTVTAQDVRIEITVPIGGDEVALLDYDDFPSTPRKQYETVPVHMRPPARETEVSVKRVADTWVVQARAPKVQPAATVWLSDPLFVGAKASTTITMQIAVFADNLASPHRQTIQVPVTATSETVTLEQIEAIENDRLIASAEYQAFLRENGYDEDDAPG